jgi:S-adenosylmethionine:tRNA-ribosyltransferase-isomerase (queuine synthetase)
MSLREPDEAFASVAKQLMIGDEVVLGDQRVKVRRVGRSRLRMVQFRLSDHTFEAIEQNPEKPSRWGKLAREKHQVVQFRDVIANKYIAVAVDGALTRYSTGA